LAFIAYVPPESLKPEERIADRDHIIQVSAVHPAAMRRHYDLYIELMHARGPLSRRERELMAVRVSGLNDCPY
jgi:alkylhydroperoxidase family enzyme